jgi:hypothetical protein
MNDAFRCGSGNSGKLRPGTRPARNSELQQVRWPELSGPERRVNGDALGAPGVFLFFQFFTMSAHVAQCLVGW